MSCQVWSKTESRQVTHTLILPHSLSLSHFLFLTSFWKERAYSNEKVLLGFRFACLLACLLACFLSFSLSSFCLFKGRTRGMWRFPGWGSNQSCSHQPMPQPQQCQIQAISATYTTAHGNVGSSTHWVRPGIKPTTPWFLVGFINHWAMTGTPAKFT